jgi:hypothetical protein
MAAESGPGVVDASVAFAWFAAVPGSEQPLPGLPAAIDLACLTD